MHERLFAGLLSLALCGAVQADAWTLDNSVSRLSFVSTKAGTVAEVHRFDDLSGALGNDGRFTVSIDLDSVDTAIDIRDQRMRDMLFETADFPTATLTAQLDLREIEGIGPGGQADITTEAQLDIHGVNASLTVHATVARLDERTLLVTSSEPLVVTASQFGLGAGVEKLREIAGLPSISPAVPVTFRLTLRQEDSTART
jgi:polyisoprenoid-binding protein YceI